MWEVESTCDAKNDTILRVLFYNLWSMIGGGTKKGIRGSLLSKKCMKWISDSSNSCVIDWGHVLSTFYITIFETLFC